MAEAHGNEGNKAASSSWLNPSEWPEFIRNIFIRAPFVRRFKLGRRKVGGRSHPLFYELQTGWLEKNDQLFNNNLKTVEKTWDAQGDLFKMPEVKDLGGLEKLDGVVPLYKRLGPYADIDRIKIEAEWFEHGTGFEEENVVLELREDDPMFRTYNWEKERVKQLISDKTEPWKRMTYKKLNLFSGTVYHEGKKELKEDLYVFGHHHLAQLMEYVEQTNQLINVEGLQEATIPVEIRTKIGDLSRTMQKLVKTAHDIEEEQYKALSKDLSGDIAVYNTMWEQMVKQLSPESKNIVIMRFGHTYRIIKTTTAENIEENIIKKDAKGRIINTIKRRRMVVVPLEFEDIYEQEKALLNEKKKEIEEKRKAYVDLCQGKIREMEQLIASPRLFERELAGLVRKTSAKLEAIIDSHEDDEYKINAIHVALKHSNPTIEKIIEENINFAASDIKAALSSNMETNEKIARILQVIQESNKSSIIIENHVKSNEGGIKEDFSPIDPSTKKPVKKTDDEIFAKLRGRMGKGILPYDAVIEDIFNAERDGIISIIKEVTENDKPNIEGTYKNFEKLIIDAAKRLEDDILGIKMMKDAILQERRGGERNYIRSLDSVETRIDEIENITNKDEIISKLKRQPDTLKKRPEELGLGLDEYGYPLEIDPGTGEVLLDKWWNEIGQNKWQLEIIAEKKGGAEVLRTHLGLIVDFDKEFGGRVRGTPKREIRKIADQRFFGYYDLLETSALIFSYWDTVRDDLRDGRYHPWSKSHCDYVIEGEGGFDERLGAPYVKSWLALSRSKGIFIPRKGHFPIDKTGIHMDVSKHLIDATPYHFVNRSEIPAAFRYIDSHTNLPADEVAVSRHYRMRMPDGSFQEGERKPTKYNPAFDRRGEDLDYVYWGNMYYWRWSGYPNEWSENPFPQVSTRGIAMYIAYIVASDAYNYKEAEEILEGHPFDYGVRGSGEFGNVNPLSGKNVLQEN